MEREQFDAPRLNMDQSVTDFYAFDTENVCLDGYQSLKGVGKIPVAI